MKGMNITEKILSRKSDKDKVSSGEIIKAKVDWTLLYETHVLTIPTFYELAEKVWDPDKVVAVTYLNWPPTTIDEAKVCLSFAKFVEEQGIKNFYRGGHGCVHQVFIERYPRPGQLVVATDSRLTHGAVGAFACGVGSSDMAAVLATGECWFKVPEVIRFEIRGKLPKETMAYDLFLHIARSIGYDAVYKAMEFSGPTIREMSMDGRMCMCTLAVEVGAKNAIIEPDEKTLRFLESERESPFEVIRSDVDASYFDIRSLDVSELEPQIAEPPNLMNSRPVTDLEGKKIDQAVVGTCSGGRLEDLETVAKILKGRKVHPEVELVITAASRRIWGQALEKGFIKIFHDAGAVLGSINCGPCLWHEYVLGPEQVRISNQNRNYRGRCGDPSATILLSSAATVAASAIEGQVTDPRDYV